MDVGPLLLSFEVATSATVIVAVVATALGAVLSRRKLWFRDALDAILTSPLVLPPTVLGYYLLVLVGRRSALGAAFESLTGSAIVFTRAGAVVAAAVGSMPLAMRAARTAFEGVDRDLVDAARTLGASSWRAFVTIELPLARVGILSGLLLSFARALGDFGITWMVAGDIPERTRTAPLAIFDYVADGRDHEATGLALIFTALSIVVLYAVTKLTTKVRR